MTEPLVEQVDQIIASMMALVPGAVMEARQIAMFMNDAGLKPSATNVLALLLIVVGNLQENYPKDKDARKHLSLLLEFAWEAVASGAVGSEPDPTRRPG